MGCKAGEVTTDLGCIPADPANFAQFLYNFGVGLIGITSFLFLLYGSYIFMTSQARPDEVSRAKTYIFYSIFGLLFALFGIFFLNIVLVQILQIPGFQ